MILLAFLNAPQTMRRQRSGKVGPAFFAAKGKAPVVLAWSRPLRDGRYRCEVIKVYQPEAGRDIWGFTQQCIHDLERVIRRHPSCWVLNYRYFRKRPAVEDLKLLASRMSKAKAV